MAQGLDALAKEVERGGSIRLMCGDTRAEKEGNRPCHLEPIVEYIEARAKEIRNGKRYGREEMASGGKSRERSAEDGRDEGSQVEERKKKRNRRHGGTGGHKVERQRRDAKKRARDGEGGDEELGT